MTSGTSSKTRKPAPQRAGWLEPVGLAEEPLSKGKLVTLGNLEPHPRRLPAGLPGAAGKQGSPAAGLGGRKSLSYEDKDPPGSLCSFRADFYFLLW